MANPATLKTGCEATLISIVEAKLVIILYFLKLLFDKEGSNADTGNYSKYRQPRSGAPAIVCPEAEADSADRRHKHAPRRICYVGEQ